MDSHLLHHNRKTCCGRCSTLCKTFKFYLSQRINNSLIREGHHHCKCPLTATNRRFKHSSQLWSLFSSEYLNYQVIGCLLMGLLHSIGAFILEIFFPVIDFCIGSCIRKWNLDGINWIFICPQTMKSIKWKYSNQYLYCPWLSSLLILMYFLSVVSF